mmetsp:Transcript_78345/g.153805  ORF Transcript_78345/g.153805 Transcript_78345/m.153805 type:complete len:232 (-) Transcript_78345:123-818(-)
MPIQESLILRGPMKNPTSRRSPTPCGTKTSLVAGAHQRLLVFRLPLLDLAQQVLQRLGQILIRGKAIVLPVLLIQSPTEQNGVRHNIENPHKHPCNDRGNDGGRGGDILGLGYKMVGFGVGVSIDISQGYPCQVAAQGGNRQHAAELEELGGAFQDPHGEELRSGDLQHGSSGSAEALGVHGDHDVHHFIQVTDDLLPTLQATHAAPQSGLHGLICRSVRPALCVGLLVNH